MKVTLLAADLGELTRIGATVGQAFARGSAAVGSRPTHQRPTETSGTEAALQELVHLYADAYAQMRYVEFAYATKARTYEQSKGRYDAVDNALFDIRRTIVPDLRTRLGQVRAREEALVREVEMRGLAAEAIGPIVPPERAQETSVRPGEGPARRRPIPALPPPRPSFVARLRRRRG